MAKDRTMSTPSRTPYEEILESCQVITTLLEGLRNDLSPQIDRANAVLADLSHRVEVLEQKQGMGEAKRGAKQGQAQSKRKGR